MNRVLTFITLFSFALQQFTCCCGSVHGAAQAESHPENHLSDLESDEHHCHHHHSEECPDSQGTQLPDQNPCCPDGHHLCISTHLVALNSSRDTLDEIPALCIWTLPVPTPLACFAEFARVELIRVSDPGGLAPSLERLCVFVI